MCAPHLTRRDVLAGAVGAAAGVCLGAPVSAAHAARGLAPADITPVEVVPGLVIKPRAAWGADLPPLGPIAAEEPRFLLVHHTATPDTGAPRDTLRSIYRFHTGPEKGWVDVCYQFFVDRDGGVWEGRAGALDGPVMADATGGSQGWAQLVCLIGDFSVSRPSSAARNSLVSLLGWLAQRYLIDTGADATASFTSRGSNRWPAGTKVTTPTVCAHRDMTFTSCPGAAFYPDVRDRLPADVHAWRLAHPLPRPPDDRSGLQRAERGRRTGGGS